MKNKIVKDKQNGIDFIGSTKVSINNKMHINAILLVLQFFFIISGVYGTIFSFISAFSIEANVKALLSSILISTIVFCFLYKYLNSIKYIGPILIVVYIISGYTFRHEIWNGLLHLENEYIEKFNLYYNANAYRYIVGDFESKQVITIFLIFIILLLTGLLSSVIFRNTLQSLFIINTLPIILLSFTVGLLPAKVPFTAFLACCIGIYGLTTTRVHKGKLIKLVKRKRHKKGVVANNNKALNLKQEQKIKYIIGLKVGGVLATALIFLFFIISFLFTPKLYKEKIHIESTKHKIQNSMMNFSVDNITNKITNIKVGDLVLFQNDTASGGLGEGKLGEVGKLKYKYETALKVKTSVTGYTNYLKGYVGCEYKGNKWVGLSEEDKKEYKKISSSWDNSYFEVANQNSYFMSLIKNVSTKYYPSFKYLIGSMQIENVNANPKYLYSPYYPSYPLVNDLEETNGTSIITKNKKKNQYNIDFYANLADLLEFNEVNEYTDFKNYYKLNNNQINEVNNIKTIEAAIADQVDEYRTYESAYRTFVYDVYTRLPNSGLDHLKRQFEGITYADYRVHYQDAALNMIVVQIRKFLDENTSYSLEPGVLPKNKDFIEYFLYENKLGYCTHYATAATMILRTMGVPARYVEGYIIKEEDITKGTLEKEKSVEGRYDTSSHKFTTTNKTINILDSNAHAWVEVYIDGFGWVPVEFTPGYSADITIPQSRFTEPETTLAGNFDTKKNPEIEEANNKSKQNTPINKSVDDEKSDIEKSNSNHIGGNNKLKNSYNYLLKLMWIILSIIIILGITLILIWFRFIAIQYIRSNRLKSMNQKQKVIMLYNEIKRILDYYNIVIDDSLTEEERAELVEKKTFFMENGGFKNFTRIALKAKFDRMKLSSQEVKESDDFYKAMIQSIYEKVPYKEKIILKYIKIFY